MFQWNLETDVTDNMVPLEDAHPRKEKYLEQIQMDASIHNWFSNENMPCI